MHMLMMVSLGLLCFALLNSLLGMGLRERFCVLMYLHAVATRAHAKRDQLTANIGREGATSLARDDMCEDGAS
jgi:hypothetical protein